MNRSQNWCSEHKRSSHQPPSDHNDWDTKVPSRHHLSNRITRFRRTLYSPSRRRRRRRRRNRSTIPILPTLLHLATALIPTTAFSLLTSAHRTTPLSLRIITTPALRTATLPNRTAPRPHSFISRTTNRLIGVEALILPTLDRPIQAAPIGSTCIPKRARGLVFGTAHALGGVVAAIDPAFFVASRAAARDDGTFPAERAGCSAGVAADVFIRVVAAVGAAADPGFVAAGRYRAVLVVVAAVAVGAFVCI
ncbi:hypothetical protein BJX63DRAFT_430303 [Aspergillus granulosus]|uniref:Uncharacterized protein n=1 Tax=Aspergillus granulosus TaxID=176169 RepID=A0ABR4HLD4_9EURO